MSTASLTTTLVLSTAALSLAWSLELGVDEQNSQFYILHRQACLLWYLTALVLMGLVFSIVVLVFGARKNRPLLTPIVVAWLGVLSLVLGLQVYIYRVTKQPSGVYSPSQVNIVTTLTHLLIMACAVIDIYALLVIAKREVVVKSQH